MRREGKVRDYLRHVSMMITKGEGMEPTSGAHLVDRAGGDLARARRARARAARVRQVNAVLLGLVEHVGVARALNRRLAAVLHHEGDGEHLRGGRADALARDVRGRADGEAGGDERGDREEQTLEEVDA